MNQEFSSLLSDVKEQILYLQELGVENLSVDLPEIDSSKFKVQSSESEIPRERLEKFIPTDEILQMISIEKPKVAEAPNQSRKSLLESTKLSRLPSLGNRPPSFPSNLSNQPREEMPQKKVTENLNESLFGDIKANLPDSGETIEDIRAEIGDCKRCQLCEGRTKIVHSTGNRQADLMIIGEAPGADEDQKGEPFVGRAGQLLTKIIEGIQLKREDVFIGNINRCRPPQNRAPLPNETAACKPFLLREIAVVKPKVIIVLGNTAMKNLLDTKEGITKLRGIFQDYYGVKVMPTFHPAYLLRDPSKKREVWEDMKKIRDYLNGLK
ncbi:MAG TPA: uracil-DNA glycosylase [Pyrinomonadaceae bacterium]|nr:uracil-DNA glycosylase [Pyrinomonadaceae bacterium]